MKITRITLHIVNVPERRWWWSDDVYGQPLHQRTEHGVAEVETDQGLTGLTLIGRFTALDTMRQQFATWLGQDVLQVNLAQSNDPLQGAFEQAVLDLRGQALGVPIWQLLGGSLARPRSGHPMHGVQNARTHRGRRSMGMGTGLPRL